MGTEKQEQTAIVIELRRDKRQEPTRAQMLGELWARLATACEATLRTVSSDLAKRGV